MSLHFYKRTTLASVFTKWKKFREDFHFHEENVKAKVVFSVCCCCWCLAFIYLAVPDLVASCGTWDLFLVAACRIFCCFHCDMQTLNCGMWNLVPWAGIEPRTPELGVQGLSHWTAREVPSIRSAASSPRGSAHPEQWDSGPAKLPPW